MFFAAGQECGGIVPPLFIMRTLHALSVEFSLETALGNR
jgi:hypothetical protein